MNIQYIDGINDLRFQDGTIRGTLVIKEPEFNVDASGDADIKAGELPKPNGKIIPVGTVMTSLPGLLQIHAALDMLIKRLIESDILQSPKAEPEVLDKPASKKLN